MKKHFTHITLLIILAIKVASCTPGVPYEIRSPCVSGGEEYITGYEIYPCTRKPVNINKTTI